MTKWLKRKGQEGGVSSVTLGGGTYHFHKEDAKGTALPDKLAEELLATGDYEEIDTPWHKERRNQIDKSLIDEIKGKIPEAVRGTLDVVAKKGGGKKGGE